MALAPNLFRCVELTASESRAVANLQRKLLPILTTDEESGIREAQITAHELPLRIRQALQGIRFTEDVAILKVSNMPIDLNALPPTPGSDQVGEVPEASAAMLMIASLLGEPICYGAQQLGRLVNDVRPLQEDASRVSINSGSGSPFGLHTEDAYHAARPDYLMLLCLRNPQQAPLRVAVCPQPVPVELWSELSAPTFRIRANPSHGHDAPAAEGCRILFGSRKHPYLRLNTTTMMRTDYTTAQWLAIRELIRLLEESSIAVDLRPGDLVVLDNYRAVHGRDSFEARFDGTDRWLKRLTVARDIRPSRAYRKSHTARIIATHEVPL